MHIFVRPFPQSRSSQSNLPIKMQKKIWRVDLCCRICRPTITVFAASLKSIPLDSEGSEMGGKYVGRMRGHGHRSGAGHRISKKTDGWVKEICHEALKKRKAELIRDRGVKSNISKQFLERVLRFGPEPRSVWHMCLPKNWKRGDINPNSWKFPNKTMDECFTSHSRNWAYLPNISKKEVNCKTTGDKCWRLGQTRMTVTKNSNILWLRNGANMHKHIFPLSFVACFVWWHCIALLIAVHLLWKPVKWIFMHANKSAVLFSIIMAHLSA